MRTGHPIVALESTVLTHGLPRTPCDLSETFMHAYPAWDARLPANLAAARGAELAVRTAGAIPASIALIDGVVCVGLTDQQLVRLAAESAPSKISLRDLGAAIALGRTGGTTVASTSAIAAAAGIALFATGGIGGVHRGWSSTLDVSADLAAIARNRVLVVCAGAKILLDLPATLEALETLGIPTLGYRTPALPRFTVVADEALHLPDVVHTPQDAARIVAAHWSIQPHCGALLMQPCPSMFALKAEQIEAALAAALNEAEKCGVRGAAITPFLLSKLAASGTGERVIEANLALLFANAALAAEVARALAHTVDLDIES
ncbi:MAG: pseudouridine-5'-phosphate glycosidase [Phycisphaerales bacterium]|nr:pseudouridine-5'-phosphate glycosidase [Phycisphaerales bacterium]